MRAYCPHCHTTNRAPTAQLGQAPDCGKCHRPLFDGHPAALDEAASELEPHMRVAKVNTEAAKALSTRLNIRSISTLALFIGGHEVARQAGAMGAADIVRWARAATKM